MATSWGTEPAYTMSNEQFVGTVDYILHTKEVLRPAALLLPPPLAELNGADPRRLLVLPADAPAGADAEAQADADYATAQALATIERGGKPKKGCCWELL